MEKSEMMKRYEAETGKQSTRFVTDGIHSAGIEVWHYEYLAWLEAKAAAYDQLMSGYMTVKEIEALLKSIVEGQEECDGKD